jgi:hypothetical protein
MVKGGLRDERLVLRKRGIGRVSKNVYRKLDEGREELERRGSEF